ncbi:unnamed protein product [Closterium sp. Yama58-4]|nr:unnamed protein product [Closterium sp. Yama58-4]
MARLLTALFLLLAVTVTLASLASTAAARSARLLGGGMTADGVSGAADTIGGVITAESAPSGARPRDDAQSRRKLGIISDLIKRYNDYKNSRPSEGLRAVKLSRQQQRLATPAGLLSRLGACSSGGGKTRRHLVAVFMMWVCALSTIVDIMARLLTALALLLAFTFTLALFASTATAQSVRLRGNGMTAHGASGAVGTTGDFMAESAPSVSQPSAGGEQSRRKLQPGNTTPRQFPKGLNLFAKDGDFRVRGEASATDQGVRTVNYPIPEGLNN